MKLLKFAIFFLITANKAFGQPDFPPCAAFDTCGKDTIRVINSYSNSLYAGIDNEVAINRTNVPFKNLIVECSMGMVMEDDSNYLVIPAKPGSTLITIYQYDKGDTLVYFKKFMNVNRVPAPYITFDRIKLSDYNYLTRQILKKIKQFEVHISEDFIDDGDWFKIKEITLGYPVGQQYISKSCEGPVFSDEIIEAIDKIPSGADVSFIFTIAGSGDIFKRLPPFKIKIY